MQSYQCNACLDDKRTRTKNKCYACVDDYPIYETGYEFDIKKGYISPDPICYAAYSRYAYYGRTDEVKIKLGIAYMMLDEHIQKIIDKRGSDFENRLDKILKEFKSSLMKRYKEDKAKTNVSIKFLTKQVKEIHKTLKIETKKPVEISDKEIKEMEEVKESLKKKGIIKDKK